MSGLGSIRPGKEASLSLVTWNARALLAGAAKSRSKKIAVFTKLVARYDVVMVQEMHGNRAEMKHVFRHLAKSHWICASEGCDTATGGVTTFVDKAKFANHVLVKDFEIPGRLLGVRISARSGPLTELVLVNVHDESLELRAKNMLERYLQGLARRVAQYPILRSAFIAGDFDYDRAGEAR